MATLNLLGFESGDTTEAFATTGTFSVQGTTKRTGQYALRCNPASNAAGQVACRTYAATGAGANIARTAETFYTVYVMFDTLPSGNSTFASVTSSTGALVLSVKCSSGGAVTIVGATTSATVATLSADVWYRLDLRVTSNGTSGLAIDGGSEQTATANNITQDRFAFGRAVTNEATSYDCYYDDAFISSTAFPGEGQVNRLDPDGNGTYTAWGDGTGVTFAEVDDDVPGHDSDTTYIAATAAGDNTDRTFTLESSSSGGVTGTILSVVVYGICRSDSITGTSASGIKARNGSTDIEVTAFEWGTTYVTMGLVLDTNPDGAGAWTSGALDTLEIGVFVNASAQIQRCTKLAAMVWCEGGVGSQDVSLNTIASTTSVNNMTITPGAVAIGMNTISAVTAVNNLTVRYNVSFNTIASAFQGYNMSVTPGAVNVGMNAIAATTSVNNQAISPGAVAIALNAIAAATSVNNLTIRQVVALNAIAATTTLNQLTVTPGSVAVALNAIAATTSVNNQTITPGAVAIGLNAIASTTNVNNLTIRQVVALNAIAAVTALYEMTVAGSDAEETCFFSEASDGYIESLSGSDYATARSGSNLTANTVAVDASVGQRFAADEYYVFETFLNCDVSSLAGATISAAELSLYGKADASDTDFTIVAATRDWGDTLAAGDYVAGASLGALTELATFATAGFTTAGYNTFSNTGTALVDAIDAALAGDGIVRIIVFSSLTRDNTAPTGSEFVTVYAADEAGTSKDPMLCITYVPGLNVGMNAIAATTTVNNLTVTPGAVAIALGAIASVTTVNNLTIAQVVALNAIASTTAVNNLTVTAGAVAIALNAIAATTSVNNLTVVGAAENVSLETIASTTALYQMSTVAGAVEVAMQAIASVTSVNNLTVAQAVALGELAATTALNELTVTPGSVGIELRHIDITGALYPLTVTPGAASIELETIAATTTLYQPTVLYVVALGTVDEATELHEFEVIPGPVAMEFETFESGVVYAFHINAGPGVHFTDMVVGQPQLTIINGQALLSWLVMQPILSAQSLQSTLAADVDQDELDIKNEH